MRRILAVFLGLATLAFLFSGKALAAERLQETGEKTVIVIDPGHGGENQGTIENGHEEKTMTMVTALAMYEELLLYEDVEVYLTHMEDVDMPLKKRAEFAQSVDADFLFSIHYNASLNHELFGSEVWVSSVSPYNGYGYQFGYEFLSDMKEMGLLVRGVKTRLGNHGDYYGIIRESVALEIPAVIIEHCHVDEARDAAYCEKEEQLKEFGRKDAAAVARYFGLKSSALNVDYSGYPLAEADASSNVGVTVADSTEPEFCILDLLEADYEEGTLELKVSAKDPDSALLYYSYSLDGGSTFGAREAWPGNDTLTGGYEDSFTLKLTVPPNTRPEVVVRAYNTYDLYTESNPYRSPQIFRPEPTPAVDDPAAEKENMSPDILVVDGNRASEAGEGQEGIGLYTYVMLCLVFILVLILIMIAIQYISYRKRMKRRLQRRKEAGDIWSQRK